MSLDGEWEFALFSSNNAQVAAGKIDVPSSWELRGYGQPRYDADVSGEVGVYRRSFTVPACWGEEDPVFLRLDGVQFGAELILNGSAVGDFTSSFNAHVFDVSEKVCRKGENTLIVRTHGCPREALFDTNDDWTLHGIHRSVTLFALPRVHIRCWRILTTLSCRDATVRVETGLSSQGKVEARLFSEEGALVATAKGTNAVLSVRNARLWTSETPYLYKLEISVFDKHGIAVQRLIRRVGLREVSWAGGVLRLNGRPIELRGVNHHDLSPTNGRAMTSEEQWDDVRMIRAANCNFIRTSHYPPSEALLDACDELGVYVMDEVPFGGGKDLVDDISFGPCLVNRARMTVERDANRTSVIIWSVGNEQRITPITVMAMREVKRLDTTRPVCFPQQPNYFEKHTDEKGMADQGDLLNWHYPLIIDSEDRMPEKWFSRFDRPFISGEFAHANGLDFGYLEDYMRLVRRSAAYAGGAVWMFQDQGIVRNREDIPPGRRQVCVETWDGTWYDSCGCLGTDGVVYSDRTPQVDYTQLRQVYSPVQVGIAVNKKYIEVSISNHYDFVKLDDRIVGTWRFVSDGRAIKEGCLDLGGIPAHGSRRVRINRPEQTGTVRYFDVRFADRATGSLVFERSCLLCFEDPCLELESIANSTNSAYLFSFDDRTGGVRLDNALGQKLLEGVPLVRTDRRWMLGKDVSYAEYSKPWAPKVLRPVSFRLRKRTNQHLACDYAYAPTNVAGARLDVAMAFHLKEDRVCVAYEIVQNVERKVFETGIAFECLSPETRFDWIGQGPFETYPGTMALSNFGIWSLDARDIRFVGNRSGICLLRLCLGDARLVVRPVNGRDFAFERCSGGVLFAPNAIAGRKGCRFALPYDMRTVRAGEKLTGAFELIPQSERVSGVLDAVFEKAASKELFAPFANSYDQESFW